MKLPISFIESTRALMGDEEYQELSVALELSLIHISEPTRRS